MKYQPKVKQTQKYSDNQGEHVVCKGRLILLTEKEDDNTVHYFDGAKSYYQKPIIISETEEIEVGDKIFQTHSEYKPLNEITTVTGIDRRGIIYTSYDKNEGISKLWASKILALPEHFSDKHLQAIVDGKMKDDDEVLVKLKICEYKSYRSSCGGDGWLSKDHGQASETCPQCNGAGHFVYLDQQNHITLFPAQQSLDEVIELLYPETGKITDMVQTRRNCFRAGAEWAVKNNYKGE